MSQDEDLAFALAKALISGGVNLALPGVGSLVAVGINRLPGGRKQFEGAVREELHAALREAKPPSKKSKLARAKGLISPSHYKEARRVRKGLEGFEGLMQAEAQATDPVPAGEEEPFAREVREASWAVLGRAQLEMASSRGFVPGCWQDEFAASLLVVARDGLSDGSLRSYWRYLTGMEGKNEGDHSGEELESWAKNVTRIFALRMDSNPQLKPIIEELRRADQDAIQRALLWRLDQLRRSLALIAAALAAFAAAFGLGIELVD